MNKFAAAAALLAGAAFAAPGHAEEPDLTTKSTVAGAATGAVVGGPVGAVVGGAIGMTTGAIVDDANKQKKTVIIKEEKPDAVIVDEGPAVVVGE